ncbi:MAG TPA: GspH/FimT family pseudopilin [Candidatus Paceibacterota bacterium]
MKLQANEATSRGFTLIELLIVLAIGGLLAGAVGPAISRFPSGSQLDEVAGDLAQTLALARARSVAGLANSTHGVFLERNSGVPDRYILFRGGSYTTRDPLFDEVAIIRDSIELTAALVGDATEMIFASYSGSPNVTGTITLTHSTGGGRTLRVNDLGFVNTE